MEKNGRKEYCQNCNDEVDYIVKKVNKTIKVKDEALNVEIYECYCAKCGEKIFVYDYEKKNDVIVYDAYKKKIGLLTSLEIKEIRKKRQMTQIELARFIGIGDKDITRYESGSIQNKCIDNLLKLVQDDESYEEMVRVFYGETDKTWFNLKSADWGINKVLIIHNLYDQNRHGLYEKVLNKFIGKEGVTKEYERERQEQISIA